MRDKSEKMIFDHRTLFAFDGLEFISNCYHDILGRTANSDEVNAYYSALLKHNKMHIVLDMLSSEESSSRFPNRRYHAVINILMYFYRNKYLGRTSFFKWVLLEYNNHLEGLIRLHKFLMQEAIDNIFNLKKEVEFEKSKVKVLNDKCLSILDIQKQLVKLTAATKPGLVNSKCENNKLPEDHPDADLAAYYKAFEDAHRGSPADILLKQEPYIPLIADYNIKNKTAIDIGCGRGEWLTLLKKNNFHAVGVDLNPVMVKICQEKGLDAVVSDAIDYLQNQFDGSVGLITGFHIIEHISFKFLFDLVKQSKRVLQDGGVVIFETPNPENILVGSNTFYDDFSHQNPLTPNSVKFLFEYFGFSEVIIKRLNPNFDIKPIEGSDEVTKRMNELLYGPRDFAVIAKK